MVLGLVTGSTAAYVVDKLGALLNSGELTDIVGVRTSKRIQEQAAALGIPLSILDAHSHLDLASDGADEVDPNLDLVKGRDGLYCARKCSRRRRINSWWLQELFKEEGCDAKLRLDADGKPYVTDNLNYIVDLYFKTPIRDSSAGGKEIAALEGVVEHGLFLDMATIVIIAGGDGVTLRRDMVFVSFNTKAEADAALAAFQGKVMIELAYWGSCIVLDYHLLW
ncbi:hypothetical protein DH2020_002085 [Rehmannia glutinosa]|uniref:ribose-5-phosphate isomerase n=1 Tax=Rehmannia glutinosa TaxID=99300 RepID=A0ABR0XSS9_REHGL